MSQRLNLIYQVSLCLFKVRGHLLYDTLFVFYTVVELADFSRCLGFQLFDLPFAQIYLFLEPSCQLINQAVVRILHLLLVIQNLFQLSHQLLYICLEASSHEGHLFRMGFLDCHKLLHNFIYSPPQFHIFGLQSLYVFLILAIILQQHIHV